MKLYFAPPEKGSINEINGPSVAVSPDGRRVVFRAAVDGKNALWVRDLDSLSLRVLAGTDNGILPFWSPDSRWIAFFAQGKLMKSMLPADRPSRFATLTMEGAGRGMRTM